MTFHMEVHEFTRQRYGTGKIVERSKQVNQLTKRSSGRRVHGMCGQLSQCKVTCNLVTGFYILITLFPRAGFLILKNIQS